MSIGPDTASEVIHVGLGCRSHGEVHGIGKGGFMSPVTYSVNPGTEEYLGSGRNDASLSPRVNWAACGDVSPAEARRFALAILQAAEAAEALVPKVIAARDAHAAAKAE